MYNTDYWILCDGGKSYVKPTTVPSGINNYSQTITSNTLTITFSDLSVLNIKIPDLRGRFVMGYTGGPSGNSIDFSYNGTITDASNSTQKFVSQQLNQTSGIVQYTNYPGGINNFGGVMSQVISPSEMPAHSHTMPHSHIAGTIITPQGLGNNNLVSLFNQANTLTDGTTNQIFINSTFLPAPTFTVNTTVDTSNDSTQQRGDGQFRTNLPPYWVLAYIMRIG
jgi:microcystin-dependent protein